ncbi:reactive mitochondrial oxygen species modulator 1-domain-containing protein [Rhodotorula diobovata]|uniref:Reactive mitochondrial oxygen species modulator 1-domain-containing protein n=1 Tax=Rhodotorula diobovata TaxID=5288 RepID=A0A5C5FUV1_9BASI|nr:reactive mitochondrial oxygen species modulator 1-domain-containing protein [Rhodotorula diobovata]
MPPPPAMPAQPGAQEPSVFQKLRMGMLTGGLVGLTIGFIFGNFAILSGAAGRGKGYFPTLSTYMLSSGATFAFFMSIGTVIRTDGLTMQEWAAQQVREGRAIGMPGVAGAQAVRERMERREKP